MKDFGKNLLIATALLLIIIGLIFICLQEC